MSFFEKLIQKVQSMWKKAPAFAVTASSAINFCIPFIETLDELLVPEIAPVANPILEKIKTGVAALSVTIQSAGADPNVPAILTSIKSNLSALLDAAQVKDAAVKQKIVSVVSLVSGEMDAIHAALPKA